MLGRMNVCIEIIETTQSKDSKGFVIHSDKSLATVKAYKEEQHGSEAWRNRAAFSTATCLFHFRSIPNLTITTDMTINSGGERYNITSVQNKRGMYVEVLAEKIIPTK